MTEHLPECPLATACKHEYYNEPPIQCANCGESCICPDEERSGGLITRQRAEQIGRNIGKYGCVITEQQHLPECEAYRDECGGGCICDELRACEQRVLDATLKELYLMENMGGYPEFYFDHIRDDFRDVIDALKENP